MMNRRDFCRNLALIAAGSQLVLPEQIDALARTYELSARHVPENTLVAVHDITIGFADIPCDVSMIVQFKDKERILHQIAMNARSTYRWVAVPGALILTAKEDFSWHAQAIGPAGNPFSLFGSVAWIDVDGKMQVTPINSTGGHL